MCLDFLVERSKIYDKFMQLTHKSKILSSIVIPRSRPIYRFFIFGLHKKRQLSYKFYPLIAFLLFFSWYRRTCKCLNYYVICFRCFFPVARHNGKITYISSFMIIINEKIIIFAFFRQRYFLLNDLFALFHKWDGNSDSMFVFAFLAHFTRKLHRVNHAKFIGKHEQRTNASDKLICPVQRTNTNQTKRLKQVSN